MPLLSEATLGALFATASALAWALISLLVRSLSPTFSSVALNAFRSLAGGVLILAWVVGGDGVRGLTAMSMRTFGLLMASMLLAVGVGDTAFFESTRALGLARAMTVSTTYPLISALLAVAVLGETLATHVVVGSVVTLAGLALAVGSRGESAHPGGRLALGLAGAALASLSWAVSVVALKPALDEIDAVRAQAVRLPLAGALLCATPWAWRARQAFRDAGRATRWRLGLLAALTAISSVTFVAGVKYAGVAVATVLSSTSPVFAIPLGFFFLGERLAPVAVAGTVLTLIGVAILQQ